MERSSVEKIVRVLNDHRVRYLIVGGLAVAAHGYLRFTADIDLVLAFDNENLAAALAAFHSLVYQPRAPVPMSDFLIESKRREWVRDKNMMVFSLFSPVHRATEIDLFVEAPFDFETAYSTAMKAEVAPGVNASFCSVEDLLRLKRKAGRPRDLEDVAQLEKLKDAKDVK
jgi:predicted nucleotidyltransferase